MLLGLLSCYKTRLGRRKREIHQPSLRLLLVIIIGNDANADGVRPLWQLGSHFDAIEEREKLLVVDVEGLGPRVSLRTFVVGGVISCLNRCSASRQRNLP